MPNRLLAGACAALLLPACAITSAGTPAPPGPRAVAEAWESAVSPADELDSLATWGTPGGATWVIASAKASHRLVVYDGDTGVQLRSVGDAGASPGQFRRPNGLAVRGDRLFVVERDNHRVQVLSLPGFEPLGSFGDAELRSPYGIWVDETEPGELQAYVTDSFMYGERFDREPPLQELGQRVRRYRVQFDQAGRLRTRYAGAFGDTGAAGALRRVESIGGDHANDRLLVADESRGGPGRGSTLREYTLAGRYTGRSLPPGSFSAEAEGVVLWDCPGGGGYWVAVDQVAPLTRFHLFDRKTLATRGTFEGKRTAFTDGVALRGTASARFPGGALYAVSDDATITAFDLREVAAALGLDPRCV
jgi:3-phytase